MVVVTIVVVVVAVMVVYVAVVVVAVVTVASAVAAAVEMAHLMLVIEAGSKHIPSGSRLGLVARCISRCAHTGH